MNGILLLVDHVKARRGYQKITVTLPRVHLLLQLNASFWNKANTVDGEHGGAESLR